MNATTKNSAISVIPITDSLDKIREKFVSSFCNLTQVGGSLVYVHYTDFKSVKFCYIRSNIYEKIILYFNRIDV